MVLVFLATGFEEIEALATIDILRRAELKVVTVGVGGRLIRGSHGITVTADMEESEALTDGLEAVVLPGGMPGTLNLEHSPVVRRFLDYAHKQNIWICAICAAPSILGHCGLLKGRTAVCYPGYEKDLDGAAVVQDSVVVDGRIITARGAGVTLEFGFRIVSELVSQEQSEKLRKSMQCR